MYRASTYISIERERHVDIDLCLSRHIYGADLEKMRLGQKTLYDFKSKKEIELAIIALEKFLLRYSY